MPCFLLYVSGAGGKFLTVVVLKRRIFVMNVLRAVKGHGRSRFILMSVSEKGQKQFYVHYGYMSTRTNV